MGDTKTLVERLNDIWRDDDHARLCQGREYHCSCGYDERTHATAQEATSALASHEARIAVLEGALREANAFILAPAEDIKDGVTSRIRRALHTEGE